MTTLLLISVVFQVTICLLMVNTAEVTRTKLWPLDVGQLKGAQSRWQAKDADWISQNWRLTGYPGRGGTFRQRNRNQEPNPSMTLNRNKRSFEDMLSAIPETAIAFVAMAAPWIQEGIGFNTSATHGFGLNLGPGGPRGFQRPNHHNFKEFNQRLKRNVENFYTKEHIQKFINDLRHVRNSGSPRLLIEKRTHAECRSGRKRSGGATTAPPDDVESVRRRRDLEVTSTSQDERNVKTKRSIGSKSTFINTDNLQSTAAVMNRRQIRDAEQNPKVEYDTDGSDNDDSTESFFGKILNACIAYLNTIIKYIMG